MNNERRIHAWRNYGEDSWFISTKLGESPTTTAKQSMGEGLWWEEIWAPVAAGVGGREISD